MAEDVGIVMSLRDNVSPTLKAISGNAKAFNKDIEHLEKSVEDYSKAQKDLVKQTTELKSGLVQADAKVKDATKSYKALKDAASKGAMEQAIAEQQELKQKLADADAQLKANIASHKLLYKSAQDSAVAIRKAENAGGGSGGMLDKLRKGGLLSLAGQGASQLLSLGLESAFGQPAASGVGSILSGISSGLSIGMATGNPGIGALVGLGAGIANAATQVEGAKDEAFKSYYNDLYNKASSAQDTAFESGSAIAAQREKDAISFATLFGDQGTAEGYLSNLVDMANRTPFLYDDLTAMSKTLATYGYGAEDILPVLQTIGDTGAALGQSTADMTTVAQALGRMKSSGKTTLEYLNILNDRGIGAVGMLADAYHVDQGTMYGMISRGDVEGGRAVEIILEALEGAFPKSMEEMSQTFPGLTSTLEGLTQEINNAMGEDYNKTREAGLTDQIAAYGGELGDALSDLNGRIGEHRASLDNLSDQYQREALSAVLLGQETTLYDDQTAQRLQEMGERYAELKEQSDAGDEGAVNEMAELKGQAESLATAAYESSDQYSAMIDAQKDSIEATRELTAAFDSWRYSYELSQEKSRGRVSTWGGYGDDPEDYASGAGTLKGWYGNAYGLYRVPYDNYAALLHEGERVLTAREAREADRRGGGVSVQVTGNSFSVRSDEDLDEIGEAIASAIERKLYAGVH